MQIINVSSTKAYQKVIPWQTAKFPDIPVNRIPRFSRKWEPWSRGKEQQQ